MTHPNQMTCGHIDAHRCKDCQACNACRHTYVHRADGWWKRCPSFKWHKVNDGNQQQFERQGE